MNKKGFSLVELLIAITILGILLALAIPTMTKLANKNKETKYNIHEESLVNAAKLYNDVYYIDSFGNKKNGCSKVSYSMLVEKDLLKNLNQDINCGYKIDKNDLTGSEDSSGVIIRKVNDKYYYETILYCNDGKEEQSQANDYISGPHKYYNTIDNTYCDEEATEDNEPPTIYYRNSNFRYYYNSSNLPNPQISIVDSNTGLNNKESYNYIWSQGSSFIGNYKTYTVDKGTGVIEWHNVSLPEDLLDLNANQTFNLNITERNISDLAGNKIKPSNRADYIQVIQPTTFNPEKSNGNNEISLEDTFNVENDLPTITYTLQSNGSTIASNSWSKHDVVATINISDSKDDNIVSGLYKIEEKIDNGNWTTTWHAKDHGGVAGTERLGTITKTYTYTTEQSKTYYFRVTDWAGNIKEESYTIKIDHNPPTAPTVNLYLKNNRTNLNASSNVSGLSSYTNDTWTKNYVFTKATGSTDGGAQGVYYLVTTSGAVGSDAVTDQNQSFKNINVEGTTTVSYKACDSAGNCSDSVTKTIKEDRTPPTNPTVNMYIKKDSSTLNSSSNVSGLSTYPNNTWKNQWVFTKASGSTDEGAKGVYYLVTTSGAVGNDAVTDQKQSVKNINAEGTSTVSYKACDSLENCTPAVSKTIKLDRTAPGVTSVLEGTNGQTTGDKEDRWNAVKYKCTDALSGCTSNTSYTHVNLTNDLVVTFSDNAGNTATLTPVEYANLYLVHIVGDTDNPPNYATRAKAIESAKTEQVRYIKNMSNNATRLNTGKIFKMQFKVNGTPFYGTPNGDGYDSNPITGGYWTNATNSCGTKGERYPSWGSIKPSYIKDKKMYSCYYCPSCSSKKILCSNGHSCSNSY